MGNFVLYILEWALSLLVFLFIWKLAFAGTTLHRFNRFYLLGATLVSALIPLAGLEIGQTRNLAIETTHFANVLQQIDIYDVATGNIATENIGNEKAGINNHDYVWAWVLVCAYAAYVAVLVAGWARSMFRMVRFLKGKKYYKLGRGVRLYLIDGDMGPFSWMNCIVISRNETGFARHAGLLHEMSHICSGHYVDLVLLLLCTIVNPVCWLVLVEIRIIHEYEADDSVISRLGEQSRDYQRLLIMRTVGAEAYALASSFESNIKKRIIMIKKVKTLKRRMLYLLTAIPAIALLLIACGSQKAVKSTEPASDKNVAADASDIFTVVDNQPEFPGGTVALLEFLRREIRYPAEARENDVEGRVLVRFVVGEDGSIADVNIPSQDLRQYIRSNPLLVDKLLTDEAVRVISSMPKWKPGTQRGQAVKVEYTVPINFRLDSGIRHAKDMIVVAWRTNDDGTKQVGCMMLGKNSATPQVTFISEKKIKANVRKIKKTDHGIFFLENDTDTNLQLDAVKEALRKLNELDVLYL